MRNLIAAVALLMMSAGGAAVAQQQQPKEQPAPKPAAAKAPPAGAGEDSVQYRAKTVYDFEDDTVEGDLQRPDGELVDSMRKVKHSSLIEIRKDFIPEMLKSLEDI
jgi:hypothetical protein